MIPISKNAVLALLIVTVSAAAALAMPHVTSGANVIPIVKTGSMVQINNTHASAQTTGAGSSQADKSAVDVTGLNTSGPVRVNNLANLERALSLGAIVVELLLGGLGVYCLAKTARLKTKTTGKVFIGIARGSILIAVASMIPSVISFIVASGRDGGCGDIFF